MSGQHGWVVYAILSLSEDVMSNLHIQSILARVFDPGVHFLIDGTLILLSVPYP